MKVMEDRIIRNLENRDAEGMLEWMHDSSINCFFQFDAEHMNFDKVSAFIHNAEQEKKENQNYHWAVVNEDDEYMGTISLKHVDSQSGTAEYAISMRKEAQGGGYAKKATEQVLNIAFEEWKLNRVYLNVVADNGRAIRFYEKCGFVYEGEFRSHICIKGKLKSLKWYAILKNEYEKNR